MRLQLPPSSHLWWKCRTCSTDEYRICEAAATCPDCQAPRPADAVSYVTPLYEESAAGNRERRPGRKAVSRQKHKEELERVHRENARLRREQDRLARHPPITHREATRSWVATDEDDAWANYRNSSGTRHTEDESVQDSRPSSNSSRGVLAGQPAGHLAPLIFGAVLCDMITPAEAAHAHETGLAALGMMVFAYIYRFLEGTKDVAAAVADNVVVMSDSLTATGIEQIEIALPEIRKIFVATFAIITVVFLWILSKELRKRYGETPEANLADRLQALADVDSPPEIADPAPRLRPATTALQIEDAMPTMPWLTKRCMDAMGTAKRHQSALALARLPKGVVLQPGRGEDGEYIWVVQSVSGSRHFDHTVKMIPEGATATTARNSKDFLSCSCAGYREIIQWGKPETCSHCLAVAKTVAAYYRLFPIEVLGRDALQPLWLWASPTSTPLHAARHTPKQLV